MKTPKALQELADATASYANGLRYILKNSPGATPGAKQKLTELLNEISANQPKTQAAH